MSISIEKRSSSYWAAHNPVLSSSTIGVAVDIKKAKKGDGVSTWDSLPYIEEDSILNVEGTKLNIDLFSAKEESLRSFLPDLASPRSTGIIDTGTLTTILDGGADTVQLSENVTTWEVSLPPGGSSATHMHSKLMTFTAPSSGGPFAVTIPVGWLQMGSLDTISLSAGDADIDVVLYTSASGVVRYTATQG